jgi:hypothetical protein
VLLDGYFYYGRVGDNLVQAGLDLWPVAVVCNRISMCFDANAKPCFAAEFAGDVIEVRRYVGGTPTTYTWSGYGPKLFLNGVVQRNNALHDVVCYYVRLGILRARFQRDNFGVEYTFPALTNWAPLAFVAKVDRGRDDTSSFELVAVVTTSRELVLIRTVPYPVWPECPGDFLGASLGPLGQGDFEMVVVIAGAADDSLGASIEALGEGDYQNVVVPADADDSLGATLGDLGSGDYELVIVSTSSDDAFGATLGDLGSGDYEQVVISGGSYDEEIGATLGELGEGDYEP